VRTVLRPVFPERRHMMVRAHINIGPENESDCSVELPIRIS
jgi:hypothetical protein